MDYLSYLATSSTRFLIASEDSGSLSWASSRSRNSDRKM